MAINTLELSPLDQKFPLNLINAVRELSNSSEPSTSSKRSSYKNKKNKSPYLHNENVQMMSRVTEKRYVQKKNEMFSSFPLAANIYKASSAEFKAIKKSKKGKKPSCVSNTPALKACTVSDMSNSEYFDHKCSEKENVKKRMPNQIRKYQRKPKSFQIFDRDARFELNCSSSDLVGKKHGDGQTQKEAEYEDFAAQDVWAVLRNINQFQFNRIQQLSDESLHSSRKKRNTYKPSKLTWAEPQVAKRTYRNVRKGGRLIETVRTEEMTYVANIEIEEQAASKDSVSASSSFDRVTVINKSDNSESKQNSNKTVQRIKPKNMQFSRLSPTRDKNNRRIAPKPLPLTEIPTSATSDQKARQKPIAAPRNRLPRDNQIKSLSPPPKPMNTRDRLRNHITARIPIEEKTDKFMVSKRKSREAVSLTASQDSSNCLRENESQCTTETKLFHSNAKTEFVKKGIFYNANQNQNPVPILSGRKLKQKMTVADIKRKLGQIKFPFTILNKDELTSTMIEVMDINPPQYYGLDKQIWPFMMVWGKKNANPENKLPDKVERVINNSHKQKEENLKGRLIDVTRKRNEKGEADKEELPSSPAAVSPPVVHKKPKPRRIVRDKMMTIWQKNAPLPSDGSDVEKSEKKPTKLDINIQQMLRVTEPATEITKKADSIEILHKGPIKSLERSRVPLVVKHSWGKARQASEFIDTVISKLKNGIYYNSNEKRRSSSGDIAYPMNIAAGDKLDHKHASMQTLTMDDVASVRCESEHIDRYSPDCNLSDTESCVTIPGFDECLPELEIQTLGFNQVAVKHCLTNVTLQFDVAVPSSTSSSCASSCCVPLSGNNSQSRVYKCSTTIWNAALPAELCTVLPSLMKSMFDLNASLSDISEDNVLSFTNSDALVENTLGNNNKWMNHYNRPCPPNLMLLSALDQRSRPSPRYRAGRPVPWFVSNVIPVCPPFIVSPQLIEIMKGRYCRKGRRLMKKSIIENRFELLRKDKVNLVEIDQRFLLRNGLFQIDQSRLLVRGLMCIVVDPRQFIMPKANGVLLDEPSLRKMKLDSTPAAPHCTALQVYEAKQEDIIVSNYALFDFRNLLQDMWNYCRFNIHFTLPRYLDPKQLVGNMCNVRATHVKIGNQGSIVTVRTSMPSFNHRKDLVNNTNNVKGLRLLNTSNGQEVTPLNSIYNCHEKVWVERVSKVKEQIKIFNEKAKALLTESRDPTYNTIFVTKKAPKVQVSTAKIYNKCKSTEGKTYLDTIDNMDHFLEALGSAKHIASVFDGLSETKLMICVDEMKNWVNNITSRQALLVLMLSCKTDTPNLMRLRSLVLQGIAMNRITRATELELEIEVIEKENFTQFNGPEIQVPQREPITNREDLLEELCWIAKNTAADYQRPFDDVSEQFLNTLLQRRKNLNPAYLRVMARYVGLGLLNQTGD